MHRCRAVTRLSWLPESRRTRLARTVAAGASRVPRSPARAIVPRRSIPTICPVAAITAITAHLVPIAAPSATTTPARPASIVVFSPTEILAFPLPSSTERFGRIATALLHTSIDGARAAATAPIAPTATGAVATTIVGSASTTT
ncbi:MAG: hypothetical protein KC729_04345, partial [Candidatus Eisenbacteria bacterium]|nr:hypothetical protein [Candidatus Eisenbacteria bacterium]